MNVKGIGSGIIRKFHGLLARFREPASLFADVDISSMVISGRPVLRCTLHPQDAGVPHGFVGLVNHVGLDG